MAHPRMYDDSRPVLKRLRELCLALPEVFEKEAWGECTFRVTGGSMFAMTDSHHHGSNHEAVWIKAPPTVQEILVNADGKRFFVPPYVGHKGWLGVRLDCEVDWDELAGILEDGYRMSVPKRLRGRTRSGTDEVAASGDAARPRRRSAPPRRTVRASKIEPASRRLRSRHAGKRSPS
jgi:predicted DNA-binding protein (MmcQ/YjbR family)